MKKLFILFIILMNCRFINAELSDTLFFIQFDPLRPIQNFAESEEQVTFNYTIPEMNLGIYPIDICYVPTQNEIYVYGSRKILIYNADSYQHINTIDLTLFGQQFTTKRVPSNRIKDKRLVYEEYYDHIFCATEEMEIVVIDPQQQCIIQTVTKPDIINIDSIVYENMILKYNPYDDRLYWIINDYDLGNGYAGDQIGGKLIIYDIDVNGNLQTPPCHTEIFVEDGKNGFIKDIEFNPILPEFYLTTNQDLKVYSTNDFSLINYHYDDFYPGELLYVYNENSHINKLYCCSFNSINFTNQYISVRLPNSPPYFIEADKKKFTCSEYNDISDKVYFGYGHLYLEPEGIMVFDATDDELIVDIDTDNVAPIDLLFNADNNKIFCGTNSGVKVYDGVTNLLDISYYYRRSRGYYLTQKEDGLKVFATSVGVGSVEVFSGPGNHIHSINVGEEFYYGLINKNQNEVYYYRDEGRKIIIVHFDTNLIEILEIPGLLPSDDINNCSYDSINNLLAVILDNGYIYVYDCSDFTLQPSSPLSLSDGGHTRVHFDNNGFLYASSSDAQEIKIWYFVHNPPSPQLIETFNGYYASDFVNNQEDNEIICGGGSQVFVIGIDLNSNPPEFNIDEVYDVGSIWGQVRYDPYLKKIFTVPSYINGVKIIDRETSNISFISCPQQDLQTWFIEYSESLRKLFVIAKAELFYIIDSETNEICYNNDELPIISHMFFNIENNKLYILSHFDYSQDYEQVIYTIDFDENYAITYIGLGLKERQYSGLFSLPPPINANTFSYESDFNKLFVGMGNSVIHEIFCQDCYTTGGIGFTTGTYNPGGGGSTDWKWISFPRLLREGNNPVDAEEVLWSLEGEAAHFEAQEPGDHYMDYIEFPYWHWDHHDLYEVISSLGYKMRMFIPGTYTLVEQGTILSPNTRMIINNGHEDTWLGYFLEQTLPVEVAFAGIWENLYSIKTQYWEMRRESHEPGSPWIYPGFEPTLRYADMVVIRCFTSDYFTWNYQGQPHDEYIRSQPTQFDYQEQSDYYSIFIDLNPGNLPAELGVYVGEECKGAAVVTDSVIQVCTYIPEGSLREDPLPLEFVLYYGREHESRRIQNYKVYNQETNSFEKRTLTQNDLNNFWHVSLRQDSQPTTFEGLKITVNNYPNPFNPETRLTFSLPQEQEIELTVYNLKGQKVKQLVSGQISAGQHSVVWEGKDDNGKPVGSGLYFYKLKTKDKELTKKMLLLK